MLQDSLYQFNVLTGTINVIHQIHLELAIQLIPFAIYIAISGATY